MDTEATEETPRPSLRRLLWTPVGLLVLALATMWAIEAVDSVALNDRLQSRGIRPRDRDGLEGIAFAPMLHVDWGHVASNSVPLLALGGLVAVRGMRYWARVTLVVVVAGGGLTWLLGGGGNHVGASGLVFGYFGAILAAAIVERKAAALAAALLAVGFYSSLLAGLVPQEAISWEGHLFGFLAGAGAAWRWAERPTPREEHPDDVQPWEADEPWLD